MKHMLLADRYARALYALAKDSNQQDIIFEQMRVISQTISDDSTISAFLFSPLIRPAQKIAALEKLTATLNIPDALKNFILLLAKKNRMAIFSEILVAYQNITDEAHGVTRGTVRSATVLAPAERKRVETLVGRATNKQVIMSYKEDASLLGGLVAEVGSYTFDDSLTAHLKRMNEQLTRETN
jgi:F-type H+-transporting ATPase subunit delta